jgi:hypothetical protein
MNGLEEYDLFLKNTKERFLFIKYFKNNFTKIPNNFNTPSQLDVDFANRDIEFALLITRMKAQGINQVELDSIKKMNAEKRKVAYDYALEELKTRFKVEFIKKFEMSNLPYGDQEKIVKPNEKQFSVTKSLDSGDLLPLSVLPKKITEKWHALLFLLEVEAHNLKLPVNSDGSFIRSEIEEIGKRKTGSTGQSFYRHIFRLKDVIKDSNKLKGVFGPDWKNTVIELSNNDEIIKNYIEKHY